jgi:UDP-N-acetylglucosamine 1-carboxyvinyltransferase
MACFKIEGGHPLSGVIRASGNKNAALPALAAALLTDGEVRIGNVPDIGDVNTMLAMLESLGVGLARENRHDVRISASGCEGDKLARELSAKVRGSILLAAPLLHRFGSVELPFPGGDRIGRRRLDTHLLALEAMGARVEVDRAIRIRAPQGLTGADILLDEASVTATENTVMAAVLAKGKTIIRNAACEPHVQDLCRMLRKMGADIEGAGTNELRVHGVQRLNGCECELGADYIEVASFIALAAVTGGEITIEKAAPDQMRMILFQFRRLGIDVEIQGENVRVPRAQRLRVQPDTRGAIPKIDDSPWPGFPADLTSVATTAATQCHGSVIIFEKMFESRMFFVDQLIEMGAQIVLCDPHRAVVIGPSRLHGASISSPDIRAGMALLIASLAADGESTIGNIAQIDRGYERIDERLRALGAHVRRVEG